MDVVGGTNRGGGGVMDYSDVAVSREEGSIFQGWAKRQHSHSWTRDKRRELEQPLPRISQGIFTRVRVVKIYTSKILSI